MANQEIHARMGVAVGGLLASRSPVPRDFCRSSDQMRDKTYNLLPYSAFTTGRCADGRQVVMGLLCPDLVTVFFDADGCYLETTSEPWAFPAPRMTDNGPFRIYDSEFSERFEMQMKEQQAKIGFSEGLIQIRPFESPEADCWLQRMPSELTDLDPDAPDFEELNEERQDWLEGDNHVFGWAEEYWISRDGEVETS